VKKQYTDEELLTDIEAVTAGNDPAEAERNAYFNDPANAAEIEKQQARIDRIIAEYNETIKTKESQYEQSE